MARIGIVYGSSTGNTRDVCQTLQELFGEGEADLLDVREIDEGAFDDYDAYVFATSTWGAGDLQDDWEDFFPRLDSVDFRGKRVAIMALGDQNNYPDHFVDCVSVLVDKVLERGGMVVGETSPEGYSFQASKAVQRGKFLGLVIDEDNQSDKTLERLRSWVDRLNKELFS